MKQYIESDVPDKLKKQWLEEASSWRLPYWDFARVASRPTGTSNTGDANSDILRLPILCMMPSVRIYKYNSLKKDFELETIENPLYKYKTPNPMGEFKAPYKIDGEHIEKSDKHHTPAFTYPVSFLVCNIYFQHSND